MAWQRVGYDWATEHAQILSLLIFWLCTWYSGKESNCQCRRCKRCKRREFDPWVRKIPWRSKWQPTPIFFPGRLHRQRSLASTVHGGHRESDMTEWATHTLGIYSFYNAAVNSISFYALIPNHLMQIYKNIIDFCTLILYLAVLCFVAQSWQTHCDPMDCSPPGSSVHGILQARMLEWVDIPFSRGSSQPRDCTQVSCNAGRLFTVWATRKQTCSNHF